MLRLRFEWDGEKDLLNQGKHGVSFEEAVRVFSDPWVVLVQDRVENGEERWQAIGMSDKAVLLLVAHTARDEDGTEVIRMISARPAQRDEKRRYEEENG